MKWPRPLPTWQYCPSNVEFASERLCLPVTDKPPRQKRDRHYTFARRLHVKQLLARVMSRA
jgi:hypothetical protein